MKHAYTPWKRVFSLFLFCLFVYSSNSTPTLNTFNFFVPEAGQISSSQIICNGDTPTILIETAAPTIPGPYEYLWMEAIPGNPWSPIAGATSMNYAPPAISQTTTFTRCIRLAGSSDNYIETNEVTITVVENSVASLATAPGSGNVGDVLQFSAGSSPNSTYSWDFGDGTPATNGQSAIHIFGSNGNLTNIYTVTLTVTNANNCVTTITSTITITDVALPIDLLYFEAQDNGASAVDFKWATASEKNNEYFDLERSTDGRDFYAIGKIAGAGNSNQTIYYTYQDEAPKNGDNYYRLKQVDTDGEFEYSDIVNVRMKDISTGFSLYPNPVKKELNVKFSTPLSDESALEIFNVNGQVMRRIDLNNDLQSVSIDVENLDTGIYFLLMKDRNEIIYTEKIIKLD